MEIIAARTHFQALKRELKNGSTAGVVGIDVAKNRHCALLVGPQGDIVSNPLTVDNSRRGFEGLLQHVSTAGAKHDITRWVFGFEASGGFELPLAAFLVEQDRPVVQVSSYMVKRCREMITGSVDKNDAKDARAIAYLMQQGLCDHYHIRSDDEQQLHGLVLLNEHLKNRRRQLKVMLRQNGLKLLFPELERRCKDVDSPFVLQLLSRFPTPQDIAQLDRDSFVQALLPHMQGRLLRQRLEGVHRLATQSIGVKLDRDSTTALQLRTYVAELQVVTQQRADVVQQLSRKLQGSSDYALLCSIPGVALETGSTLLSEIGNIRRFQSAQQLISYAGLDLVNYQSGMFRGQPRLSKRGRPLLRRAAYQAVNVAVISRSDTAFKRIYQRILLNKGQGRDVKQKAKIKLCAKLLRIVFSMLTTGFAYQDALVSWS